MELSESIKVSPPVVIPDSADLDTYLDNGLYQQSSNTSAGTGSHYPETGIAGVLEVRSNATKTYVTQIFQTFNGISRYYRNKYNGTWTSWNKIYSAGNKPTALELGVIAAATSADYISKDIEDKVIGQLAWSNSVKGVILDTSAGAYVDDTVIPVKDALNPWVSGYPTLMGYTYAGETCGVRVDSARSADTLAGIVPDRFRNLAFGVSTSDPNLTTSPYILTNHANKPPEGTYWFIQTIFWSDITETANCSQIATAYNSIVGMWIRRRYDGTWTAWVKVDNSEMMPKAGGTFTDDVYCDKWIKSNGAYGWLSATYGGGIYMSEATTVVIYGSKQLQVNNDIRATGNITAYYSDERLKTNVTAISNASDVIMSWNPIKYNANELAAELGGYDVTKTEVGLGAQTVQVTAPELIERAPFDYCPEKGSKSGEDYLTIKYDRAVVYLTSALQEQIIVNRSLQSKVNDIESELAELRLLVNNLLQSKD